MEECKGSGVAAALLQPASVLRRLYFLGRCRGAGKISRSDNVKMVCHPRHDGGS